MWRTSGRAKAGEQCAWEQGAGGWELGRQRTVRGATCRGNRCRASAECWPGPAWMVHSALVFRFLFRFGFFLFLSLLLLLLLFAVTVAVLCCVRRRLSQICDETGTVNCGNLCCQRPSVCFPRYNSLDFQCLGSAVRFFFSFFHAWSPSPSTWYSFSMSAAAAAAAAVELAMTLAQNGARARQISRVRQLKMCSKRNVCPRLDQTEVPHTVGVNSTQLALVFVAQGKRVLGINFRFRLGMNKESAFITVLLIQYRTFSVIHNYSHYK